jgi:hypothetical protein
VHWTAPANNGGAAITRYVITPFKNGKAQTARSYAATATTETVKGLTAGRYTFTVTATNSRGTSPASTATTKVTVT